MFRARLRLFNPNTVPLDVTRVSLKLSLAGVEVATATTLAPFLVEPGEHRAVDLRVTTNLLRDAPALSTVLTGSTSTNGPDYRLGGYVDLARRGRDRGPVSAAGRPQLPGEIGDPVL
jgi:LEA14-like dessication related protein